MPPKKKSRKGSKTPSKQSSLLSTVIMYADVDPDLEIGRQIDIPATFFAEKSAAKKVSLRFAPRPLTTLIILLDSMPPAVRCQHQEV
jgi:hypothetical protein